jgi:hypothetical protein
MTQMPIEETIFLKILQERYPASRIIELSGIENNFHIRLAKGIMAEMIFIEIVRSGRLFETPCTIEHLECNLSDDMSWPEKSKLIEQNARVGDCLITFNDGRKIYVDVKMGSDIADDSLTRFNQEGYYMMNACSNTTNNFYLVKNNEDFRKAVYETGHKRVSIKRDGSEKVMWNIEFDRLNKSKYPGLDFFMMDPAVYRKYLGKFRIELQECAGLTMTQIDRLIKDVV